MKENILNYIVKIFNETDIKKLNLFSATSIGQNLNISRNLVSQYLNEELMENKIIKVNTRPVYFFPKFHFEKKFNCNILDNIIKNMGDFNNIINKKEDFENIIGYDGSLNYSIEQLKGAISYPGNGLPILIYGETGTGKSMLANEVFKYANGNQILNENAPFITLNCSEFADNSELLVANLFGHIKGAFTGAITTNQGLLKSAEGGILFLDEVHCLKSECQEKLFLFMDQGIYHMLGDNKNWYKSNVRLIFATTKKPEEALLKTLLRRIPIIIKIPSLDERPITEKSSLLKYLVNKEECKIGKNIKISPIVYESLMNYNFKGNIGHLKNCIKASCANAYIQQSSVEDLKIKIYNLPEYVIRDKDINLNLELDSNMHEFLKEKDSISDILKKPIVQLVEGFLNLKFDDKQIKNLLETYFDSIVFKNEKNPKKIYIKNIVNNIFDTFKETYEVSIYHNTLIAISNLVFDIIQNKIILREWEENQKKQLIHLREKLNTSFPLEYKMSQNIITMFNNNIELENKYILQILLTLILKVFSGRLNKEKTSCIIICHGYSTASSIADATNKLLDKYIFDAIDMPLDVSTNTIVDKLEEYFFMRPHITQGILLVDMGSLEQIYTRINSSLKLNIGIINNITTRLAIDIGERISEENDMENILKEACKNNMSTYKLIKNSIKENAIIMVCSSGEGTAIKLKDLFLKSLPKKINLKIIPSDYRSLNTEKIQQIFNTYNVEFIIGTLNPNINKLKYISLEKIINLDHKNITNIFSPYLEKDEIEIFKENLLENFSIHNLLDHLTILNPEKVLSKVKIGVDQLQKKLNKKLKTNTIVGLYIHISCLIERLIIKNEVKTYKDLEKLKNENKETLEIIKLCFSVVEEAYSVEIPDIEVAYIFEYIKYD